MDPLFDDDSVMDLISDQDLMGATESAAPFEDCVIDGQHLSLPIQICEDATTLVEMLNPQSLSDNLTAEEIRHLQSYLPEFSDGSVGESEQGHTWDMLFSKQNMCFGNPVEKFARQLESGCFNPEIVRTRKYFRRATRKLVRREQRNYYYNLLPKVIVSRQQLVEAASQLPPGQSVQAPPPNNSAKKPVTKSQSLTFEDRVRKRYFEELKAVDCLSSDDESYPEGPLPSLSKKQRRHLSMIQGSLGCEFKPIQSTFTQNNRGRLLVVEQPTEEASGKSADSKRWTSSGEPVIDVLSRVCGSKNVYDITEDAYRTMMNRHRMSRRQGQTTPELDVSSGSFRLEDIDNRIRQPPGKRLSSFTPPTLPPPPTSFSKANSGGNVPDSRPKRSKDVDSESCLSSMDEAESEAESVRKQQFKAAPVTSAASTVTSSPLTTSTTSTAAKSKPSKKSLKLKLKLKPGSESKSAEPAKASEETTSVDVSSLLDDRPDHPEAMEPILPTSPPPPLVPAPTTPIPPVCLTQDTHTSFFALVREIMLSADGSSGPKHLLEALTLWNSSPISPLNEWYSQLMALHQRTSGGWPNVVQSALDFLTLHGIVSGPLADSLYAWEAHGKDSDMFLQDLSLTWFQQQQQQQLQLENGHDEKIDVETTSDLNDSIPLSSAADASLNNMTGRGLALGLADLTSEEAVDQVSTTLFDQNDVVLPPRSVTSWLVRPSTTEERVAYQEQERQRYAQPHKAFTFRQHGYEGIVGPVKGVYSPAQGVGTPGTKVRGHNLMVQERPACVTLLSLVRDAAARLPNGEGTRADICELMKDSQYLAPGAEASLHSVVSGALDRLHYEADPCVKYDSTRKVWIYLHRHRSEAEFEQLHKQHQGMPSRVKKPRSEQRQRTAGGGTPVKGAKAVNAVCSPPANQSATAPSSSAGVAMAVEVQSPPAAAAPAVVHTTPGSRMNTSAATMVPGIVKLNSAEVAAIRSQHQELSRLAASSTAVTAAPPVSMATTVASATSGATIQTFQITTSTGVQTIRVAAPSNLPTALLARTLQLSAQQHSAMAQGQKISVTSAGVNGTSSIKQVILSPSSALSKAVPTTLLAHPRPAAGAASGSAPTSTTPTTSPNVFQLNAPSTSTTTLTTATVVSPSSAAARARLPASPVRLVGRQAVTTATSSVVTGGTPIQTFLIRPPAPSSTASSPGSGPVAGPRLVMVNNKLINLSSTSVVQGANRIIRPGGHVALATAATSLRKPGAVVSTATSIPAAATGARPVLARVVTGPGGANQQQVITLENLLSLAANPQHNKGGSKGTGGVVQLPLSAIAGLNVAGSGNVTTSTSTSSSQPTTVLLQNVKGGQSILLPAGFQGGTINIRGVRLATVSGQANAAGTGQPKQAFVARLVTPQHSQLQQAAAVAQTAAPSQTIQAQPPTAPQPKNAES